MRFEASDQPIHIAMEVRIGPHGDAVTERQLGKAWRQLLLGWDCSPAHKHGNHGYFSFEGGFYFDPHKIFRIVNTPLAGIRSKPIVTDYRQQYVAFANYARKMLTKIDAQRDRIHVLKDSLLAEMLD